MPRRKRKAEQDPRLLAERPLPRDGRERRGDEAQPLARSVTVSLSESPLCWLHARGYLSDRQLDSGEKLRCDWERANLAPSVTMSWDRVPPARKGGRAPEILDPTERQMVAKQRFDAAMTHLGSDLSDIAWRIICAGEGVPVAEKNLGWPVRSGKLVLRIALDRLADFYRLP